MHWTGWTLPCLTALACKCGLVLLTPADAMVCRANRDAFLRSAAGQYLVQFHDLSFKQQIGDGSVGRVHLGKWQVSTRHEMHGDCCRGLLPVTVALHNVCFIILLGVQPGSGFCCHLSTAQNALCVGQETDVAIKMLSSLAAIGIRAPNSARSNDKMMRTLEHEVTSRAGVAMSLISQSASRAPGAHLQYAATNAGCPCSVCLALGQHPGVHSAPQHSALHGRVPGATVPGHRILRPRIPARCAAEGEAIIACTAELLPGDCQMLLRIGNPWSHEHPCGRNSTVCGWRPAEVLNLLVADQGPLARPSVLRATITGGCIAEGDGAPPGLAAPPGHGTGRCQGKFTIAIFPC